MMVLMGDDNIRFKDFSGSPEPIIMRIAPDDFRCYPEIPLDVMMDVVKFAGEKVEGVGRVTQLMELLHGVIMSEDLDQFIARTKRGTKEKPNPHPIGMRHITAILPWIMEVYGLRPTQESSGSADGSDDTGISSTAPASDEASTS